MNGVVALEHAIGRVHHRFYACCHVRHLSQRLPHDSRRQSSNNKQTNKQNLNNLIFLETTTTLSECHSQEEPCCISCYLHSDNRLNQVHISRSQLSRLVF
jgi:hypothetical protein